MTACRQTYARAGQALRSAVRIAVVQGALPDDWRAVYDRLDLRSHRLSNALLRSAAAMSTLFGVFAVAGTLALIVGRIFPTISPHCLAAGVILPALLGGAAAGQAGGNLFLRHWYGLDDATRRGFATRLSLGRCPIEWPAAVRRWLFTGDWLGAPAYDLRLPYVRIFVEGDAPETCREEDAVWREIHSHLSGDVFWEAGTNIREISYPNTLPAWARQVEKGDGYADLERRIGSDEAGAWVAHLWRRACRQWPELGTSDGPDKARRECFEMHSLTLEDGREALVVVLRPTAFVLEIEDEAATEDSIAA